jgi:hypothetical protein
MNSMQTELISSNGFLLEVDRVLRSDTLRTSEVSRRLLKFLSEKSAAGQADQLKEYTIAVDALDRPPSYDPRHDSTVRIQMGRLRRKLTEYYATEGKNHETVIDLPRGRFKLVCVPRAQVSGTPENSGRVSVPSKLVWTAGAMWLILVVAVGLVLLKPYVKGADGLASSASSWNNALNQLWSPYLATNRPLIIAVEDPLFIATRTPNSRLVFRNADLNAWDAVESSPDVLKVRKALDNPDTYPTHYYTPYGEVGAAFMLGRALGARVPHISVIRTSEFSQQQLADSNVVVIGNEGRFEEQLQASPIQPQLSQSDHGVKDSAPAFGAPSEYVNPHPGEEDGEVYALVSHLPGPLGSGDVQIFTSKHSIGYMGAVESFSNAASAQDIINKLRAASGHVPRYYQVLLKIRFKDEVPVETNLILTRELHPSGAGGGSELSLRNP